MRYFDEHRRRIKKHDFIRGYQNSTSSNGESIILNSCAGVPLKELSFYGNTLQGEGTPSPESPITITNTGDAGTVIVKHGINLLPDYAYNIGNTDYYGNFIWSRYKDKVVYLKEGTYRVSADFTSPYARICFMAFNSEHSCSVPPSGIQYRTDDYQIADGYINVYGQAQNFANQPPSGTPMRITVEKPIYVHFWFSPRATSTSGGNTAADKQYTAYNCMLVSGKSALPYEEYIHNEIKIPSEYKLAKIDDYADEILIKDGKVKYIKRIEKFDSFRVWESNINNIEVVLGEPIKFYIIFDDKKSGNDFICSHYEVSSDKEKEIRIEGDSESGKVTIYGFNDKVNTEDKFYAFLEEQISNGTPLTIYYILENPIETDITNYVTGIENFLETPYDASLTIKAESALLPSSIKCKYYSLSNDNGGENEL